MRGTNREGRKCSGRQRRQARKWETMAEGEYLHSQWLYTLTWLRFGLVHWPINDMKKIIS